MAEGTQVSVPSDRGEWLKQAQWFADDHQPESLLALVGATRAAYPNGERDPECLRFTAEAYLGKNEYEKAVEQFQAVIASFPTSDQAAWAQYGIGEVYRWSGKQGDALAAYAQVRTQYPSTEVVGWATLREGNVSYYLGRVDDALAKYREVAKNWEGTQVGSRGQGYIAETFYQKGRYDEAAVEYQKFIDQYTGIAYRSQIAKSHGFIADIAKRKGDYETALQRYTTVITQFADTRVTFDAYYGLLECAKALERANDAVNLLKQATETVVEWKGRAAAMVVLQRAYDDAGSGPLAEQVRERIKADFPASHELDDLAHNVFWLARRKPLQERIRILEDGLHLNLSLTKRTQFRISIAHALYTMGDFQAAIGKYRDLVADPEVKPPCKAVAQYEVWRLSLGDPERAKAEYEALLKGWPDSVLTRAATRIMKERGLIPASGTKGGE
jgi:tetratricopeptide (TPR) repeat protein